MASSFACGARTSGRSAARAASRWPKCEFGGFTDTTGVSDLSRVLALVSYASGRSNPGDASMAPLPPRYAVKNTPRQAVASIVHRTIVNRAVPTLL